MAILLYFIIPNLLLFITVVIFLGIIVSALMFLKIEGHPLPIVIKNFIVFLTYSKFYLWQKKTIFTKFVMKPQKPKTQEKQVERVEKGYTLRTGNEYSLKRLSTILETKVK